MRRKDRLFTLGASPHDVAQQILESHALTLAPGPRGRLLVVPLVR